jgi:hypothetical protein
MNIPNFAGMSVDQLMKFWFRYSRATRKDAVALVGARPMYTRVTKDLANYASNRATMLSCRRQGDSHGADMYRGIAHRIWTQLPIDVRAFIPEL